ncbi:MAG: tyrosine-type recombinase/integrase [Paraclostridium sp.]
MKLIDGYIDYIKNNKKLTDNTVNSYFIDIRKYMNYVNNKNLNVLELNENDIIGYIIDLEKTNASVATISRTISSIKSFHEYIFLRRYTETNIAINIKKPKIQKKQIDILTKEEIEKLLNFSELKSYKQLRDKAIFETLYGTGVKVSELIKMNLEDINLDLDYIYCDSGKNSRIIPLSKTTKKYIALYINKSRLEIIKNNYEEKALFVNTKGDRFTRQGLWKLIKKYTKLAGIDKNINPNMLRNSFAIHLLNEGANAAVVNKILGNINLSSLQLYLDYVDKNIRQELKEKHPRK